MNKKVLIAVTAVGVVIALLSTPGDAMAGGGKGSFVVEPSQTSELHLKGSHGYSIWVIGEGDDVSLTAMRGGSSATYTAGGTASATRLKARFGRYGRISMRFHSDSGPRRIPGTSRNCHGKGEVVDRGHWIGQIAFRGEQSYTTVRASRAEGKVTRTLKETCGHTKGEHNRSPSVEVTILSVTSKTHTTFLTAFKVTSSAYPALDGAAFSASLIERSGQRLTIVRTIDASAKVGAFASTGKEGQIESAMIEPPAPFKGSATFQRIAGSKGLWSGSLVGYFLGRGEVTLTGPEFSAEVESG